MFNLYEEIIPYGDNYDFIPDKTAEYSLASALTLTNDLDRSNSSTEEGKIREELGEALSSVIGFRKAEKLAKQDSKQIAEELSAEGERRNNARRDLEMIITALSGIAHKKYPNCAEIEIKRDSYHCFGVRSAIIEIYNLLYGTKITPDRFSQELLDGKKLSEIISNTAILNVAEVLPYAIIYSGERKKLEDALRQTGLDQKGITKIMKSVPYTSAIGDAVDSLSDISGADKKDVKETLINCLGAKGNFEEKFKEFSEKISLPDENAVEAKEILMKAVKEAGSELKLIQAFKDVSRGAAIEYVLSIKYTKKQAYPLAKYILDNVNINRYLMFDIF